MSQQANLFWERSQQEGAEVVRISGAFCLLNPEKLDEFREMAKGLDAKRCVLDMREVGYMDSAGLGIVAMVAKYAAANSSTVIVIPSTSVRKLMATTGIERAVIIAESIPAALDVKTA